jgi:hypothetical protein
MQLHSFYLPHNLDLHSLLTAHNKPALIQHLDKFYWFISLLYVKKFVDKRYSNADASEYKNLGHYEHKRIKRVFIPVHSDKLRQVLTTKLAKKIIDTLVELKIVEVDKRYMPKEKTKSYRLAAQYHNSDFKKVACQSELFNRKLETLKNKELDVLSMVHKQILQNMYCYRLDVQAAEQILDSLECSPDACISAKVCIEKIIEKDFFFTTDKKSGRIFHNFCNLKRELRSCLRDENNLPLVDIDISNSQPFFLAVLLKECSFDSADIQDFQQLCKDGQFYDYLANKFGLTRNYVKNQMWNLLFGKNIWQFKLKKVFTADFPTVYSAIEELNRENNSDFAVLLQKLEAEIMIDTVAPILLDKGIKFITVHDSFLVSQKDVDTVYEIMQNCFQTKYGIVPTMRKK